MASTFRDLFGERPPLIGMVHLLPLPGSPRYGGSVAAIVARAVEEARALEAGGLEGLIVENFGDAPFTPGPVDPAVIATMTAVGLEVRRAVRLPIGVNVLKTDARAALGVAQAAGGGFIRINVHVGAAVADQGILQGEAYQTLRYRRAIGADVLIFADVQAKHGVPLAPTDLEQEARDAAYRGLADALIVSGKGTGEPTDLERVRRVKRAVPDRPVLVGSGATADGMPKILEAADGVIVGTELKRDGRTENTIDPERVARLVRAARG
jgi:membrane complex biogenesis BtpA family protein